MICSQYIKVNSVSCGDGFYARAGELLCGAHYRAKYALDFDSNPEDYRVKVGA